MASVPWAAKHSESTVSSNHSRTNNPPTGTELGNWAAAQAVEREKKAMREQDQKWRLE